MQRLKYFIIAFIVVGGIIALLLNNKAKMEAKSENAKIEAYPVNVVEVAKSKAERDLVLVGTITANNDVAIVSEAQGRVTKVYADVGDYKSAGSPLIQLDDELKLAEFKTTEVNYQKTKKDYERYQALLASKAVTDAQLENAKLAYQSAEAQYIVAKKGYEDTKITTPISGIVTSRNVDIGNYVNKNMIVAEVVDISKLKVKLNVAESDVFKLNVGDKVKISTDIYPGVTFPGKIETISDKGDEAHTYPVEVTFMNSRQHPLKAGMFGKVAFNSISKGEKLLIPRDALIGSIKNPQVFVIKNSIAKIRDLVIGSTYNDNLEVLSGLKAGEEVVVNGQNNLADNYKVMVVQEINNE
ncbi:MAG: efflux RND transporter periplasmic adaptor subunit [Ignavibacteriaceae bacterium]